MEENVRLSPVTLFLFTIVTIFYGQIWFQGGFTVEHNQQVFTNYPTTSSFEFNRPAELAPEPTTISSEHTSKPYLLKYIHTDLNTLKFVHDDRKILTRNNLPISSKLQAAQCICSDFECTEQPIIKQLFEKQPDFKSHPNFVDFKRSLLNYKLRTSPKLTKFVYNKHNQVVSIKAMNHYNQPKTHGGDHWIARILKKRLPKMLFSTYILPKKMLDFGNGSYTVFFPKIDDDYLKNGAYSIEVYLEKSAEMIELNRRVMMIYDPVGRGISALINRKLVNLTPQNNFQDHYRTCSTFKLTNSSYYCDFSGSIVRTWYCYGQNLDCLNENQRMRNTVSEYTIPEVAEQMCGAVKIGKDFQKRAFVVKYEKSSLPIDKKFRHWIGASFYENAQPEPVVKNSQIGNEKQMKEFALKIDQKIVVVIGDSVGKAELPFIKDIWVAQMGKMSGEKPACETEVFFWGRTSKNEKCETRLDFKKDTFGQVMTVCRTSEKYPNFTKFVFIPHGKPIHHGGCIEKMPWMVNTIDKLEKYENPNNVILLLTPAAHFSIFNPAVYMSRLIELRLKLYELKLKYSGVKIVFKTLNYVPNNFENQGALVSAYNAKRMDRIAQSVFNDSRFVEIVPLYDMSEVIFEAFGHQEMGFHPGQRGSAYWIQHGIMKHVLNKF